MTGKIIGDTPEDTRAEGRSRNEDGREGNLINSYFTTSTFHVSCNISHRESFIREAKMNGIAERNRFSRFLSHSSVVYS